jgi:hypothetical protein
VCFMSEVPLYTCRCCQPEFRSLFLNNVQSDQRAVSLNVSGWMNTRGWSECIYYVSLIQCTLAPLGALSA